MKESVKANKKSFNKNKEIKSWSTSIKKGDTNKRIEVEKLDNHGFLVTVCLYGNDSKGNYIDETKKYYSEINPLEPQDDPISTLFSTLSADKY